MCVVKKRNYVVYICSFNYYMTSYETLRTSMLCTSRIIPVLLYVHTIQLLMIRYVADTVCSVI